MPRSLFDAVRHISASEAAEHAGLYLVQRGSRLWTCCPLHRERTPSMMFNDNGRWHCFGCHQGGDATDLYAALYRLEPDEALRRLAADFHVTLPEGDELPPRPAGPSPGAVKRGLKLWRNRQHSRLCDARRRADKVLTALGADPDTAWDNPDFVRALRLRTDLDVGIEILHTARTDDLADLKRRWDGGLRPGAE